MKTLQNYLDQKKVTRYKISKVGHISTSTLQSAVNSPNGINGLTVKVLCAIAMTLNKTPGQVLDEIIALENKHK